MNQFVLIGNLGKTPELHQTDSGRALLAFTVADNRKDKDGNDLEPEWYDVVLWEHMAELYSQVLEKGQLVWVLGRLQVEQYDGNDGVKRVRRKVHADAVGWRPKREGQPAAGQPRQEAPAPRPAAAMPARQQAFAGDDDPFGDQ